MCTRKRRRKLGKRKDKKKAFCHSWKEVRDE